MGQVRHGSATTTHAVRAAIQRSQVEGLPAISPRAGLRARAAEPGAGHQPQDGCEVAQARDGRGYEDRADGTALDCADRGRGGDGRGILAAHTPAAGRLSLCPATLDPAWAARAGGLNCGPMGLAVTALSPTSGWRPTSPAGSSSQPGSRCRPGLRKKSLRWKAAVTARTTG
jgi:hypothetical protein